MNEQVSSLVRHILTFAGGILVTKGMISEGMSAELVGVAMSLIGLVWGQLSKMKK